MTLAGVRALAEQARMAGRKDTAATAAAYELVADELEAGAILVDDVAEVRPIEREQQKEVAKAARRERMAGEVLPEVRMIGGHAYVDQISAALFIGSNTGDSRQSIARLPVEVTERNRLYGTRKVHVGLHNSAALVIPVRLLTAEALDAIAANFDKANLPLSTTRAARLRQLSHLRAVEQIRKLGIRVLPAVASLADIPA